MAEVLSQSQIDALLATVLNGNDVEDEILKEDSKKYRNYDFYSPKKFTKDKLNIIKKSYDNYCRIVSSRINSLLRVVSEVNLITVEEERYYEFNNALLDTDILSLIDVKIRDNDDRGNIFVHITTPLMLGMIDRMLGGNGDNSVEHIQSSYVYTDIELMLYENILKHLIGVMKDGWSSYLDTEFNVSRLETSQGLLQEIGMDEIVIIVVIEVVIDNLSGKMSICIPNTLLTNIFSVIERKKTYHNKVGNNEDKSSQAIFGAIKQSTLDVSARIGDATVLMQDIYSLKVGDIINMNVPKDSDVDIFVEDRQWFRGSLGVHNKNIAVRISDADKK